MIAIDAASLEFIVHATAEGRLPNFGRILDRGRSHAPGHDPSDVGRGCLGRCGDGEAASRRTASVALASITCATTASSLVQLLPNYCFAYQLVRFGFLAERPHTSATLRAQPLWSMLSAARHFGRGRCAGR